MMIFIGVYWIDIVFAVLIVVLILFVIACSLAE